MSPHEGLATPTAAVCEEREAAPRPDVSPADILDILLRAASLLFVNGQTTERITKAIEQVALSFGFVGSVFVRWGELRIHLTKDDLDLSRALVVDPLAVHMGKVAAAMKVLAEARDARATPKALRSDLRAIEAMAPVSTTRFALMAAAGAAALGVIFGATDLSSLSLIALSAGAGALLRRWVAGASVNAFLQPFCAALLAGAIGALVVRSPLSIMQHRLIVLCPCMILIPGPHLLNGTIDLLRARIALGASRVVYSGMIVLAICAGVLISLWLGGVPLPGATSSTPIPLVYDVLAAGVAVAAFGAFFSIPWALLPIPMAIGMLAHAARWLVIALGGSVASGALIACLIVGTLTTPIAERLNLPFAAFGFAAVVSLIPGVYLFQVAGALANLAALGAAAPAATLPNLFADAASAFIIMMAITIGLIAPKMIIDRRLPPKV